MFGKKNRRIVELESALAAEKATKYKVTVQLAKHMAQVFETGEGEYHFSVNIHLNKGAQSLSDLTLIRNNHYPNPSFSGDRPWQGTTRYTI